MSSGFVRTCQGPFHVLGSAEWSVGTSPFASPDLISCGRKHLRIWRCERRHRSLRWIRRISFAVAFCNLSGSRSSAGQTASTLASAKESKCCSLSSMCFSWYCVRTRCASRRLFRMSIEVKGISGRDSFAASAAFLTAASETITPLSCLMRSCQYLTTFTAVANVGDHWKVSEYF